MGEEVEVVELEEINEADLKTYPRRWFILFIVTTSITLRGFNQSVYGPSNNRLATYFNEQPWQIDWLVLVQSVIFLFASLPLSMITVRIGYRAVVLATTSSQALGFALTAAGFSFRTGYPLAMLGQAIMGFSNIISWSLAPPTAAIWFAKREVATAVATQVVGRGVGEAMGAYLPTKLTSGNVDPQMVGDVWKYMYTALCMVGITLTTLTYLIVKNKPPTPPSVAQMKAERHQKLHHGEGDLGLSEELRKSGREFWRVVKLLFKSPVFICVWFLFGASNPILRNNNVLLSSAVNKRFTTVHGIDTKIGTSLMVAWIMYTVGGFVTGPILTWSQKYKPVVIFGEFFLFLSCVFIYIGVKIYNMDLIYAGVTLQGFMVGSINTSLFELLAEVSYPNPTLFVTMIAIICMGVFRFAYPIVGRLFIMYVGAPSSELFPCVIMLICVIIILAIKPIYERKIANEADEKTELLEEVIEVQAVQQVEE